jgi:hypothetical protein
MQYISQSYIHATYRIKERQTVESSARQKRMFAQSDHRFNHDNNCNNINTSSDVHSNSHGIQDKLGNGSQLSLSPLKSSALNHVHATLQQHSQNNTQFSLSQQSVNSINSSTQQSQVSSMNGLEDFLSRTETIDSSQIQTHFHNNSSQSRYSQSQDVSNNTNNTNHFNNSNVSTHSSSHEEALETVETTEELQKKLELEQLVKERQNAVAMIKKGQKRKLKI